MNYFKCIYTEQSTVEHHKYDKQWLCLCGSISLHIFKQLSCEIGCQYEGKNSLKMANISKMHDINYHITHSRNVELPMKLSLNEIQEKHTQWSCALHKKDAFIKIGSIT